ncbi:MAG: hypothetical protein QHI38_11115 [Armatimonadota bacterium]|nr:hypothetical protein [Armatimonadota bacterium]
MRKLRSILVTLLAVVLIAGTALATLKWQKAFNDLYKPSADSQIKKAKCALCHLDDKGKKGLNPYGKLLQKKKKAEPGSFKAVEKLDADKDGFSNIDEIKAGTLPGDPKSKPPKK